MELQNQIISLGNDSVSIYRRRIGVVFGLEFEMPWHDKDLDASIHRIAFAVPEGRAFDLLIDERSSVLKTAGLAQGVQPLAVLQSDGVLTIAGRDMASLTIFTLSVGTSTLLDALQAFSRFRSRMKRLIIRMPSRDLPNFVYLDLDKFWNDPLRIDLAVKVSACIFVPQLVVDNGLHERTFTPVEDARALVHSVVPTQSSISVIAVEPHFSAADLQPVLDMPVTPNQVFGAGIGADEPLRRLTLIIPLSDDLRSSFLGFGYTVAVETGDCRVLEIGAFRRNFRSSYSRLMGGTDVVDLKAQPLAADAISDLQIALQRFGERSGSMTCFIGSEVLSAEVLAVFRAFATQQDVAVHAVVCSAAPPAVAAIGMIHAALDGPDLHLQTLCFVAAGEPSGLKDAIGRPRGYFGVPPVEGQSMARCMEFRSNVTDPAFSVPASVPPREAHALERFVNAFRPLRDDLEQKPAA